MEAKYVTNKEGERVGVVLDIDEYRASERMLAEIRAKLEENEALILKLLETARRLPQEEYEHYLALIQEGRTLKDRDPEEVEKRMEQLENHEALLASTDDAESEEDWEAAVPLRLALERIDASREASGRSGGV